MGKKTERHLLSGNKEEQIKQWQEELRQQDFFKKTGEMYTASSVESWLEYYTGEKYKWLAYMSRNEDQYEAQQARWLNLAHRHLEAILQKKLFDLQCRWRAEQVQLPGIEICFDFEVWEANILNCPLVEPVNREDLNFYLQYLRHPDAEPGYHEMKGSLNSWQDYDELQRAQRENYAIPEWYEYHNQFTGAAQLLTLPNIRGEKEQHYHQLSIRARVKEAEAKALAENKPRDTRPILFSGEEKVLEQALEFEGPQVRRARKLYRWKTQQLENNEFVSDMIEDLLSAEESVPIEAHGNWLEALKLTHRRYQCQMIAAALPPAYEQYQMNIQMGIAFPCGEGEINNQDWLRNVWKEEILTGRRLAGEPENFDF